MKLQILDTKGTLKGEKDLPSVFSENLRTDIIKRAVLSILSFARQSYGADPRAGKRASSKLSKRRRKYRGSYGRGWSRTPRKILTRRGTQFHYVGASAPQTRKGQRAHPPKAEKVWDEKINKKERRKAIRSAMSATLNKELVSARGHVVGDKYPFGLSADFEGLKKTKDVKDSLIKLGLDGELSRCSIKKVRAGKGKMRNRKYKRKTGPLIVVSNTCSLSDSAKNIPGVDIVNVRSLNASKLAPGTDAGRLTLWTESALEILEKENLYV
jgi:large subunit ribosomal protein L4e